jgi:hypothetical protein
MARVAPFLFSYQEVVYALTSNCHFVHCHQLKNRKILISALAPDIAFTDVNMRRNAILSSEIELKVRASSFFFLFLCFLFSLFFFFNPSQLPARHSVSPSSSFFFFFYFFSYNFAFQEEVGRGGFASVFKALYNGQVVAVKKLNACSTPDEYAEFQREVWVMSGHDSPFLVYLHGVCLEPPMLVMEYLGKGTLYQVMPLFSNAIVHDESSTQTCLQRLFLDTAAAGAQGSTTGSSAACAHCAGRCPRHASAELVSASADTRGPQVAQRAAGIARPQRSVRGQGNNKDNNNKNNNRRITSTTPTIPTPRSRTLDWRTTCRAGRRWAARCTTPTGWRPR